jgi:DNA-binding NarL/FixJ family response regulator
VALNLKNYEILIVDDVREMRTSLSTISKALGAQTVHEAKSGEEAIEQLQTHDVDIVLCDYNLGEGRDGQQVFEEAKESGMIAPHTAFVMITADNTMDVVMAVVEHSPDGYLIKPLNKSVLELRLEKVLHRKRVFKEIEAQMADGNYAKAAAICDIMIEKNPGLRLDLLRAKSEALFQAQDADAVAELCAGILMERDVPWATVFMGRARYLAGDFTKARILFNKAIEQNNTSMEAYDWLVRVERECGDSTTAQRTLQQAVKLSPKSIRRQQVLAELAVDNGDHETARKAFEAAVELGVHSCFSRVDDRVGLVNAVAETDGAEAALGILNELSTRRDRGHGVDQEKFDWRLDLSQGQLLLANQRAVDAKAPIKKALAGYHEEQRDAADPSAIALAKACYAVGMTAEAQELMDRIVRENHDREDVIAAARVMFNDLGMEGLGDDLIDSARRAVVEINNRGVALAKQGKLGDAVDFLTRASDELPGNLTISLNVLQAILSLAGTAGYTNQRQYMMNEYMKRAERIDADNPKLNKLRQKILSVQQTTAQQVVA